ncbi:hypothetical protein NDA17_006875 [Ustilago hordei]|nr:hypothetical protein NDA17_006875 [Ustilago hordei]
MVNNKHGSYAKSFLDNLLVAKNGSTPNPQSFSSNSTSATANTAASSAATSLGTAPLLTAAFKPHKPSSLSSSASASASEDGAAERATSGYDAYLPSTLFSHPDYDQEEQDNLNLNQVDDDDASSIAASPPLSSSFKAQQLSLQALSHHRSFSTSSSRRTSTSNPTPDYTTDILATLNDQHFDEEERIDKVRATLANALYAIEGLPSPSARIDNLVLDLMHRHREDVQPTGAHFSSNPTQSPLRRPARIPSFSTSRPWTPSRPSFSPASSSFATPTESSAVSAAFANSQRPTSPHLGSSALSSLTSATTPAWPSPIATRAASPRPHPGVIGSGSPRASPRPWNRTLSNLSTTSLASTNGAAAGTLSPMSSLPPGVFGNPASRPASPSPFSSPKLNIAATEFKPRTGPSTSSTTTISTTTTTAAAAVVAAAAAAAAQLTPTRPALHLVRRPSSNASSTNLALANKSHAGAGDDDDDEFSPFGTVKPAQQPLSYAGFTLYDPDAGWTSAQTAAGAQNAYQSSWPSVDMGQSRDPSDPSASATEPTAPLTPFDMLYSILVTGTKAGSSEWSPEQVDEALVMHNYDVEKTLNAIWENDGKPLGDGTRSLLSGAGPSANRFSARPSASNSPRMAPAQLPATAGVKAGVNVMSREALGLGGARGQRPALSRSGSSQISQRYEAAPGAAGGAANRVCRYYLAGECRRSDCRFSHDLDSRAVCRYWLKGHCAHNPCNFLHDYDALNQLAAGIVSGLNVNDASASTAEPSDTWPAHAASAGNGAKEDFPELGGSSKDGSSKSSYAATLGGGAAAAADASRNRWASTVQRKAPTDAVIRAHSDSQGVISIHSKAGPMRSQPGATGSAEGKQVGKAAAATSRTSARIPLRPSALLPTLLTGSSAASTYQTHRADVLSLAEQRNKLLARASEAYRKGDVASASKFSKEASSLNHRYEDESRTAAHAIVKDRLVELRARLNDPFASGSNAAAQSTEAGTRNLRGKVVGNGLGLCLGAVRRGALQGNSANLSVDERTECLLDLHGLHAKEAVELTEKFLLGLEAEAIQGLAYLAIGKGKHSSKETDRRRVAVEGFVKQFLSSYSYPFAESEGLLVVDHLSHL